MENIKDSNDGKTKEVKTKGTRGVSLRACVAKAAGWTLEKANSTMSEDTNINKTPWIQVTMVSHHNGDTLRTLLCFHGMHVILKTITRTRTQA